MGKHNTCTSRPSICGTDGRREDYQVGDKARQTWIKLRGRFKNIPGLSTCILERSCFVALHSWLAGTGHLSRYHCWSSGLCPILAS